MPSKDNKTGNGSNELLKEHKDLWPRGPSIESIWVDKNRLGMASYSCPPHTDPMLFCR